MVVKDMSRNVIILLRLYSTSNDVSVTVSNEEYGSIRNFQRFLSTLSKFLWSLSIVFVEVDSIESTNNCQLKQVGE